MITICGILITLLLSCYSIVEDGMYTEIIKIVEGALSLDREKVLNYSRVLAENCEKAGEIAFSKKIRSVLKNKQGTLTALDSFSTKPVDSDSRLEIVEVSRPTLNIDDVMLNEYTQEQVLNFITAFRCRDKLIEIGIDEPHSILLYGPPGCGKTTIAKYIASTTGLPLVTARLDGLVSSLLGSTSKNIRKIFEYASRRECVLFLDEFDVIAKLRDDRNELGELKRVVNALIQNIDAFDGGSILVAATNHHKMLDPAIWRRFSSVVALETPKLEEIKKWITYLLKEHSTNFVDQDKKLHYLVEACKNLSYSDIKTVLMTSIKGVVLAEKECLTICDILKTLYLHQNHVITDDKLFIEFLLKNGATHREIHDVLKIPLRRIQAVSKLDC